MESEKDSLIGRQLDEAELKLTKLANEMFRMKLSMERTQSDVRAHGRRTKTLSAVAALLLVSILAIAWVGSPLVTEYGGLRNRLPVAQAALNSMDGRLSLAENKLNTLEKDRPVVADRIAKLETSSTTGIRRARSESFALVEGVKKEMNQNRDALSSRVDGRESTQREAHDEIAGLKGDLTGVRQELAEAREADVVQGNRISEVDQVQNSIQGHVARLELQMANGQDKMDELSSEVDRQRIDFEVSKNKADKLVDGVILTVQKTDVGKQQVEGWLQIVSDGRFVWLRDAGAQHPIPFASKKDDRAYQLVFTKVSSHSVVGYLLVPKTQAAAADGGK
jgi:chromosome segregation ATPase